MKKTLLMLFAALLVSTQFVSAKKAPKLKTQRDSVSYAMGLLMGKNMDDPYLRKLNIDMSLMQKGMADIIGNKTTAMDPDDAYSYLMEAIEAIDLYSYDDDEDEVSGISVTPYFSEEDLAAMAELDRFFEETRLKPGIIELESGVLYEILEDSDGQHLTMEDRVAVAYIGMQIDGTIVDEDPEEDPFEFYMPNIVDDLGEALTHFSVGGRYRVYYPVQQLMKDDWYDDILDGFPVIMEFNILEIKAPRESDYSSSDSEFRYRFYEFEADKIPAGLFGAETIGDSDFYLYGLTEVPAEDFPDDPYKVYTFNDRFYVLDDDGIRVYTNDMNEVYRERLNISTHSENELLAFLPKTGTYPIIMVIKQSFSVYDRGTDIIVIEDENTIVNRGYFRITQTRTYDSTPYDTHLEINETEDGYRFRLRYDEVVYQQNREEIKLPGEDIYYDYTPGSDIVLAGPGTETNPMRRLQKEADLEEKVGRLMYASYADLNGNGEEDICYSEYNSNDLNVWLYQDGAISDTYTYDMGERFVLLRNEGKWPAAYILCGFADPEDEEQSIVKVFKFEDGSIELFRTFPYEAEN